MSEKKMIIETNSPEETFELGKRLGEQAKPGWIFTLVGDLGVGKTVFTCPRTWNRGAGEQPDLYDCAGI